MKKYFIQLSVACCCLLSVVSCVSSRQAGGEKTHPALVLFDTAKVSKYQVIINVKDTQSTGIMVCKYTDNEWRGSLITEMGVKIFDFVSSENRCRLQNTISFLDKWYIRKTLESDWAFLFWSAGQGKTAKNKRMEYLPDGRFILTNEKRNLKYSFQPIEP